MPLPRGFNITLKKLIRDGIPPRQAMKKAWEIHRYRTGKNPRVRRVKKTFRQVEREFRKVPGIKKRTARRYAVKSLSLARRNIKAKQNPIAIYNPRGGTLLPASSIEIRYRRAGGEYQGQWFRHPFNGQVKMIGLPDGSVLLKSPKGKRLWGNQ